VSGRMEVSGVPLEADQPSRVEADPIFFAGREISIYLFCRRKPGPLGQVRDKRLCHLSKLFVVSGVRFQVSVKNES